MPALWSLRSFSLSSVSMPVSGSCTTAVADANRAQAGSLYTYKPGFAEASGQRPGDPNVGPMAQTMARDPLASTAVVQDPETGMLTLDKEKLLKLQSAGIASLQRQVDEMRRGDVYGYWR